MYMKIDARRILIAFLTSVTLGCSTFEQKSSGIVPLGKDTYMVSLEQAVAASSLPRLQATALAAADSHCKALGRYFQPIALDKGTRTAGVVSNFAEVKFRCLSSNDPEFGRPELRDRPDVVIEKR